MGQAFSLLPPLPASPGLRYKKSSIGSASVSSVVSSGDTMHITLSEESQQTTTASENIFTRVSHFWYDYIMLESEDYQQEINEIISESVQRLSSSASSSMDESITIDAIAIINDMLECLLNQSQNPRQLRKLISVYSEICTQFQITECELINLWLTVSKALFLIFGKTLSIELQYSFDCVALYVITLIVAESDIGSGNGTDNDAVDNDDDDDIILGKASSLLDELITLSFIKNAQNCLIHTFGAKYFCRWLENRSGGESEIVMFWRSFAKYRQSSQCHTPKSRQSIFDNYLSTNKPHGLVARHIVSFDASLIPKTQQQWRFSDIGDEILISSYQQTLQWLDKQCINEFRNSLSSNVF